MRRSSIAAAFVLLLTVMVLVVSCGEDPFFHNITIKNYKGETVTTVIVGDGDYTLPEKVEGLENILEWIYEDRVYSTGEKISITKDSEITAVTGIILTVDNGDGTTQGLVVKESDRTVTLPKALGPRAGYAFDGWLVDDVLKKAEEVVDYSADMKIKGKWTVVYTVTYDANGGTGTIAPDTLRADEDGVTLPDGTDFTKGTSKFSSWNTSADGSGTEYKAEGTYSEKAGVTLYAIWRDEVTVSFDMDNGTPAEPAQTITYGTCATKPTANPTRTGYIFLGWVDKDGATFDFDTTAVTGDITIKAKWEQEYDYGDVGPGGGYVFSKTAKTGGGYNYLEVVYVSMSLSWSQANSSEALTKNGYSDWRVPSINELQQILNHKTEIVENSGASSIYTGATWSSDEVGTDQAKVFEFNYNYEDQIIQTKTKSTSACAVAVRSF